MPWAGPMSWGRLWGRPRVRAASVTWTSAAARNLTAYLDDQREATGALPDDRTIVIERFRDEIGDWRICVLSPFGGRVHAPWAMAIERRMSEALGIEVEATWADDGIAIRLPDADALPPTELIVLPADEVEGLVIEQLGSSPLFAARFRENAARALLIPRRRPGQRTPLWQQRLKAHDLQQVAVKYASFPIVLETYREVLSDVFELPALRDLLARVGRGEVRVVEVESSRPSPFACSLLFDYIATYMYEGDTPLAERRAQALTLDRALLAELLSAGDLRELLDADAIAEVEDELHRRGRALSADELHDLLRRTGDLDAEGHQAAAQLVRERRAVEVRIAGRRRLIAAEDAGLYRDGAGVDVPPGLPAAFLELVPDALRRLVLRHARGNGPFTIGDLRQRLGVDPRLALDELAAEGALIEGAFRPGGSEREWIEPDVLRRVRRRTLAHLRRAVEPVEREALARFLPGWHGIGRDIGSGDARLREVISQLGGVAMPVATWEQDVLPLRVPGYRPPLLDAACASGEVVWIGAGEGRVALYLRDDVPCCSPRSTTLRLRPRSEPGSPPLWRARARCSSASSSIWSASPIAWCCRRSGNWRGRARSPTMPGTRFAPAAGSRCDRYRRRRFGGGRDRPPRCRQRSAAGRWSRRCSTPLRRSATAPAPWRRRCSTDTASSPAPPCWPKAWPVASRRCTVSSG